MKVVVGSKNPVKIRSVQLAFEKIWPNKKWEVVGVDVASGVSAQPMSDEECIKGAKNRAKRALKAVKADFGVGLEGGQTQVGKQWFDCGWAAVVSKKGIESLGCSARVPTPRKVFKLIKKGLELGEVDDIIFSQTNSKHGDGHFGLMTNNAVTRTDAYIDGIIMALTRFIHPQLFEK